MTTFGPKFDKLLAKRGIHPRRFKLYLVIFFSALGLILAMLLVWRLSNNGDPQPPTTDPEWCACGDEYIKCKASKDVCEDNAKTCLIACPSAPTTPEDFFDIFGPGHVAKKGLGADECGCDGDLEQCLGVEKGVVDTNCVATAHFCRLSCMPTTHHAEGHREHETDGLKHERMESKKLEVV